MPGPHDAFDYTTRPLAFKVRKAARYTRLYGPDRTLAKVRSQYHMRRRFATLPAQRRGRASDRHVGLIGCGRYAYAVIAYYLRKDFGAVIRGAMDVDVARAASLFEAFDADYYTDDAEEILADPRVDLVYVASNHASHADYAIAALERGKHVHIEKPHVVDPSQLERLCAAMQASSGGVALGFNRPKSGFGRRAAALLRAQPGPMMLNWFVVGHAIPPGHWYHDAGEGGRVLGNLCHWSDHVLQLVEPGRRLPVAITPLGEGADLAVAYRFGEGSQAVITFSSKGEPFEGVRERFAAHRGDLVLWIEDFQRMGWDEGPRKHLVRGRVRDHGHRENVRASYAMARPAAGPSAACAPGYVRETAELFLATRDAIDGARPIVVAGAAAKVRGGVDAPARASQQRP